MTNIWAKSFFIISLLMMLTALVLFGFSIKASYEVGAWYDKNRTLISEKGGEYLAKFKNLDRLLGRLSESRSGMPRNYFYWLDSEKAFVPEGRTLTPLACGREARLVAKDAYFQALVQVARFVDSNMKSCSSCGPLLKQERAHNQEIWKLSRQCQWLPEKDDPNRKSQDGKPPPRKQ